MEQSFPMTVLPSQTGDDVLVISRPVFRALHPIEQLMAQALERVGKVRIVENEDLTNR